MGSTQRIHRYTVFRPISAYLHTQDKRRTIYPCSTQQSHQDGPTRPSHILQQSSSARLSRKSLIRERKSGSRKSSRLSRAISAWHASISGFTYAHEPSSNFSQPSIVFWFEFALDAKISITKSVSAPSRSHDGTIARNLWRHANGCHSKRESLRQRDFYLLLPPSDICSRWQSTLHTRRSTKGSSVKHQRVIKVN